MKKLLLAFTGALCAAGIHAQCVTISPVSDTTVVADGGMCSAVFNYTTPTGVNTCSVNASDTFNYTGSLQYFVVPAGTVSLTIEVRGAQGGSVNVSCTSTGGLGAEMIGDFSVTPGDSIAILVGQEGLTNGSDAGGGGGSFVVGPGNTPMIIAGGGGGATNNITNCGSNLNGLNATITTDGTASGNGIVAGGTAGNGGGASTGSGGGGGGFLTDGVAGTGFANNNGKSFLNGGAGGAGNNNDGGGYGGGGAGWFTGGNGGGGGGYSGGGTSGSQPYSGGGGGGSYNAGINQNNTAGVQTGNGRVIINYQLFNPVYVNQVQGLPSGSSFPVGTTTQVFVATDSLGNTDTATYTVTVLDTVAPVITCPSAVNTCNTTVTGLMPTVSDLCSMSNTYAYTLTGATTGSGSGDASGSTFNVGVTTVTYTATDSSGNSAGCSFGVTVVDCSGVEEVNGLNTVQMYPNPTNGDVSINLGKAYTEVEVTVNQISGKQVRAFKYGTSELIYLNIRDLSAGIYMITIRSDKQVKTLKLVKQ